VFSCPTCFSLDEYPRFSQQHIFWVRLSQKERESLFNLSLPSQMEQVNIKSSCESCRWCFLLRKKILIMWWNKRRNGQLSMYMLCLMLQTLILFCWNILDVYPICVIVYCEESGRPNHSFTTKSQRNARSRTSHSSGFIYYEFSSKILIFWWLVVVFLLLEWINREFSI